MSRANGTVGAIVSDYATLIRPTCLQVVSSAAGPINPAYSRNAKPPAFTGGVFTSTLQENGTASFRDSNMVSEKVAVRVIEFRICSES